MKMLFVAALAAMSTAGAANAATSYMYSVAFGGYAEDTAPGATHAGRYSVYCLTQSAARQAMGTDSAVTYETYASWLGQDFAANRAATTAAGQGAPAFSTYDSAVSQYSFYDSTLDFGDNLSDSIIVCFYAYSADLGYKVIAQDSAEGNLFSANDRAQASSGWKTVPEPTGGLLALLGCALLALRRKR